jgi:hypothetical protein
MTPEEIKLKDQELILKKEELIQKGEAAKDEVKAKRNALIGDLIKFFIGTVVLGFLTNFMNDTIQNKKIELEANRNESEHLSKFVGQYLNLPDLDQKKEFLEFMITISYSDITRSRYENLLDSVNHKIARKAQLETEIKAIAINVNPQKAEQAKALERQIVNAQASPEVTADEVDKKQQQLDKIVKDDPNLSKLQELNQKVAQIDNSYLTMKKIISDTTTIKPRRGYQLVDSRDGEWIKEDYFRIYEKNYLAANDLNAKSVTFQMRSGQKVNEGLIANFNLVPGQVKIIDAGEIRYEIELTRIGAAGRFPLPKAAIYSIKVFKKL